MSRQCSIAISIDMSLTPRLHQLLRTCKLWALHSSWFHPTQINKLIVARHWLVWWHRYGLRSLSRIIAYIQFKQVADEELFYFKWYCFKIYVLAPHWENHHTAVLQYETCNTCDVTCKCITVQGPLAWREWTGLGTHRHMHWMIQFGTGQQHWNPMYSCVASHK